TQSSRAIRRPIGRVSTCVFFETLLMMGVGGGVADVLLWSSPLPTWVRVCAAAMAIGSLIPVCPPVLRRLIEIVAARRQLKRKQRGIDSISAETQRMNSSPITWRLLGGCYAVSLVSCLCIGLEVALLV